MCIVVDTKFTFNTKKKDQGSSKPSVSQTQTLGISHALESLRGLDKTQVAGPPATVSHSVDPRWGSKIYLFNNFAGVADSADLGATL